MSEITPPSLEEVNALITRGPYHQWLGLKVLAFAQDSIEIEATYRDEWRVRADAQYTHGGILAALVDLAADWALAYRLGRAQPTIDMRVDYHRPASPGNLIAKGRVIRFGRQFSVCEAQIFDAKGEMVASGRGTYITSPPAPATK
jgi:uncharacterized protein (TIGR00369 family)